MKRLLALLILAGPCFGQNINTKAFQPFVDGTFSLDENLGYKNPVIGFGGGFELNTTRFLVRTTADALWARKIDAGDGLGVTVDAGGYVRVQRTLFGAGDRYSREITSQYTKGTHRPWIGIGYDGANVRILDQYLLPFMDQQNALQGLRTTVLMKASQHFRVDIIEGVYHFRDTRVPGVDYGGVPRRSHFGVESGLGIEFLF